MRISAEKHSMTPEQIALFRYSVIAPIVTRGINSDHSKEWYFRDAAKRCYTDAFGNTYRISASTIKRWYLAFSLGGLEALNPSSRKDKGGTRKVSDNAAEFIKQMLTTHPKITATTLYQQMITKSIIDSSHVSLSTVCRYVSAQRKTLRTEIKDVEMKRYEMENVNDVWCGDTTHGPKVLHNGEFKKVYVIAFIDDKSRYIVSIGATISDNTLANTNDRAIRISAGKDASIVVTENDIRNATDASGEYFKASGMSDCTLHFSDNAYDGTPVEDYSGGSSEWTDGTITFS